MSPAAIELDGVVKRFGKDRPALDGITAHAEAGRITGLIGPDGAGKSTLMRLLAGLLAPTAGTIRIDGHGPGALEGTLGYMPQHFGLYEDLSVGENLRLYADLNDLDQTEERTRRAELLHFSGLGPFEGRLAGNLSGGMKQRLGLSCTLLRPPAVLLLDEPSAGVDPISRRELWQMVRTLSDQGMAVVWATAYLDEAARCDKVWLLDEGRLIADVPPAEFLSGVRGRCFRAALKQSGRRRAQMAAQDSPGVLDAQIRGAGLNLVMAPGVHPPAANEIGAAADPESVEPTFEDAVVARLRADHPSAAAAATPPPPVPESHRAGAGPVVEARGLCKQFGDFTAVQDVDLTIGRGEIFGLLGPNGAGKSTTFRMLCGLLPASGGHAEVAGYDLGHARAAARARIGYMSQGFALYGNLDVVQNLRFFAGAYGLDRRTARQRCREVSADLGLDDYAEVNAEALPAGLQRRLALACAIVHRPDVLFLDEPTSGTDAVTRREFWSRINAMAEAGVTVMVTSHFLDEAEYCDRLAIMYRSRIIALGAPAELKAAHPDGREASMEDVFVRLIELQEGADAARAAG